MNKKFTPDFRNYMNRNLSGYQSPSGMAIKVDKKIKHYYELLEPIGMATNARYLRDVNNLIETIKVDVRKKRVLLYEEDETAISSHKHKIVLQDINDEFMYVIANNPSIMYELGSRKFEELIAKLFADRGHEVSLTKSTRDGGYDIWAKVKDAFSEFIVLAECKKYSSENKVGVEIVRGLYGVTEINKANQGLIITSSFFTKDAHQEQLRIGNRIGLKDYNNLVEWLKPYSK